MNAPDHCPFALDPSNNLYVELKYSFIPARDVALLGIPVSLFEAGGPWYVKVPDAIRYHERRPESVEKEKILHMLNHFSSLV